MRAVDGFSLALRSAAGLPAGLWLLAGWGAAEALWWPIIPDFALALLAFTNPPAWLWLTGATVAGSMAGGLVAYALGGRGIVPPLPMTTLRMAEAVDGWLRGGAAHGVWHQPLSGVPFKVFAYRAHGNRVPPLRFLAVALLARGARMLAVGAVAAALGQVFRTYSPAGPRNALYLVLVVLALAAFGAALNRIYKRWT